LSFEFDNGTIIEQEELPVTITVDNTITGISKLSSETFAFINNSKLCVESPVAEIIQVYSTSGVMLYNIQKPAGNVNYPVNQMKGTILIVKGSSGWVRKVIMN
jgi:hypothetical protein